MAAPADPPPPRARHLSDYQLPLAYPARVAHDDDDDEDGDEDGDGGVVGATKKMTKMATGGGRTLRTSSDFVNARLVEAGLPLGGVGPSSSSSSSSLASHSASLGRFVRDMEGTGCYDAVRVRLGMPSPSSSSSSSAGRCDVTVKLREKRWYRLHVGGGVNADDLTSLGGGGGGGIGGGNVGELPKLQFETSASLLNLTGYADVSSASYSVDQTGTASFGIAHDRPLVSCLSRNGDLYRRLMTMPDDPNGGGGGAAHDNGDGGTAPSSSSSTSPTTARRSFLGMGSRASLGLHATFHDEDHERTRSSKEYARSLGVRLANHNVGSAGSSRPSTSPPESMAGPYLFAEWSASLRDVLPKRCPTHPYRLDCSREVALGAGTSLKHSLSAGLYLNGCRVDDRRDPTVGYDAHVAGEVAGPPGDVGYWKLRGGASCHLPVGSLLRSISTSAKDDDGTNATASGDTWNESACRDDDDGVTGMALHSSFNCGVIRPLAFGRSPGDANGGAMDVGSASSLQPSDRFYVGGPGQLRGFLPAGIGPRSNGGGGSSVPGGDALGGDLFYASTLAVSAPFPPYLAALRGNGARMFGFANAGTCVSASPLAGPGCTTVWNRVLMSSRLAVGGGVSVGSPLGRFEATYAVPLRYGPRDARRSVQFGLSAQFG